MKLLRRGFADPYAAGVGLGIVLLGAFVSTGRGLGASGAFAAVAAGTSAAVDGPWARQSPVFGRYLAGDGPWQEWLLWEVGGVMMGAWLATRLSAKPSECKSAASSRTRLGLAGVGGALMGIGAVLARGCTSGLALSGGALLSVGSWIFMGATFAGAYLAAPLLRRVWQ